MAIDGRPTPRRSDYDVAAQDFARGRAVEYRVRRGETEPAADRALYRAKAAGAS